MKIFAIDVTQILSDTILVSAETLDEAIKIVKTFDQEEGIMPDYIREVKYEKSAYAEDTGEATPLQRQNSSLLRLG